MPHLTLEYSANLARLDPSATLAALNRALAASGQFDDLDIKSRATSFADFAVGSRAPGHAFVHAKLAILAGRSEQTRRELSEQVLCALKAVVPAHAGLALQLCVEIVEIERASYAKALVPAAVSIA